MPKIPKKQSETYFYSNQIPECNTILGQLSNRTRRGLEKLKIDTVEAFLALTQVEFLSVRPIGITSWLEVHRLQKEIKKTETDYIPEALESQDISLSYLDFVPHLCTDFKDK